MTFDEKSSTVVNSGLFIQYEQRSYYKKRQKSSDSTQRRKIKGLACYDDILVLQVPAIRF